MLPRGHFTLVRLISGFINPLACGTSMPTAREGSENPPNALGDIPLLRAVAAINSPRHEPVGVQWLPDYALATGTERLSQLDSANFVNRPHMHGRQHCFGISHMSW